MNSESVSSGWSALLTLQRATHATLQALAAQLTDLDLSASEINALANLADGRSRTVSELAAAAGSRPSTLTSVLDRLERRGLIRRCPAPGDRRAVLIKVTSSGATGRRHDPPGGHRPRTARARQPARRRDRRPAGRAAGPGAGVRMTPRPDATSPRGMPSFDHLMADVMAPAGRFGHREHVHLTWLAVRRFGVPAAVSLVSDGIQRTARYAGAPQKYHATVSRAWVELVGYHAAEHADDDFAAFAEHNPALLDKRLLTRFYQQATLASPRARTGWAEPDRAPFPWCHADRWQPAKQERPGSDARAGRNPPAAS